MSKAKELLTLLEGVIDVEVINTKTSDRIAKMDGKDFLTIVSKEYGLGRHAFLADAVETYNREKKKENLQAKILIKGK